jgi:hypothetical protein
MTLYADDVNISSDLWEQILTDETITTKPVIDIFIYLFSSAGHEASGGEIARALNYRHHAPINRIVSDFSKRLLQKCPQVNPTREKSGEIRYWHIPFWGTARDGKFIWILRQELIEALAKIYPNVKTERRSNLLEEIHQQKDSYETLQETTREAVVQSRIGQGQFRASLVDYWQGCSVTGCTQLELLRASHIKPWRDASNEERLDKYNGLLLLPNLDACFDAGLISFDDDGNILISGEFNNVVLRQLGITLELKLLKLEQPHKIYLQYHRENIFHS